MRDRYSTIKERKTDKEMQNEIRSRANLSLAIMARPMINRRYNLIGQSSVDRLVRFLIGQADYSI